MNLEKTKRLSLVIWNGGSTWLGYRQWKRGRETENPVILVFYGIVDTTKLTAAGVIVSSQDTNIGMLNSFRTSLISTSIVLGKWLTKRSLLSFSVQTPKGKGSGKCVIYCRWRKKQWVKNILAFQCEWGNQRLQPLPAWRIGSGSGYKGGRRNFCGRKF